MFLQIAWRTLLAHLIINWRGFIVGARILFKIFNSNDLHSIVEVSFEFVLQWFFVTVVVVGLAIELLTPTAGIVLLIFDVN